MERTVPHIADEDGKVPVLLQGCYAARENGDDASSHRFAAQSITVDPGVPTARAYLGLRLLEDLPAESAE